MTASPEPSTVGVTPEPRAAAGSVDASATLVGALFVVALSLRPQISAIGPLVPGLIEEFGTSHAFLGLLTAIPVLCMGVFALVGPSVAGWFGNRSGIALSVAVIVASGVVRAVAPGAELVLLATFGVGVGTAVIGPILAMFVRDRMPGHMVGGTSSYAAGTIVGAALGAALAVPLATAFGGWRGALAAISVLSAGCVVAWLVVVRPRGTRTGTAVGQGSVAAPRRRRLELPRLPVRRPVVWAIGLLFALQSWLFYGQTAWLASVYIERGWTAQAAAILSAAVNIASLVAIVGVPWGARRGFSRRAMLTTAAASSTVGLAGVAIAPAPGFLWAALLGAGLGMTFTLLLTLPTDISDDPREVGGAAALMFLVGYLLASFAPSVLGAVRDATGDFGAAIWLLVAVGLAMLPLSWSLSPRRLRPPRTRVEVRPPA
jgi:CP family cyanate transporter-like MFS transporter